MNAFHTAVKFTLPGANAKKFQVDVMAIERALPVVLQHLDIEARGRHIYGVDAEDMRGGIEPQILKWIANQVWTSHRSAAHVIEEEVAF